MKLTATVKLLPTEAQRRLLFRTLEQANAACNAISEAAWAAKTFGRVPVHHLTYHMVRAQFDLTAQMVVRCIGKVVDAYKKDQKTKRLFKKLGAVPYDERILNWHLKRQEVSIWLLGGRQVIPFVTGEHQLALLRYQQGESDLVYRKGEFYLFTTCEVPDETEFDPAGFLGVDLGIVNIATDSDGETYSASHLLNVRHRYRRMRSKLQRTGTQSAKRLLRRLSGRESRFRRDVNHTISKRIVEKAQDTGRGIALEDLQGLRARVTVRQPQRATLHTWSFFDLRQKIAYSPASRCPSGAGRSPQYQSDLFGLWVHRQAQSA